MWILLIIVLIQGDEFAIQALAKYDTEKQCISERIRVEKAMLEAYPEDDSFKLKCKYVELKPTPGGSPRGL